MTSGGGLDLFSKIKSILFSIGLSGNKDSNTLKRRASDHEGHPAMPKYRRVTNIFPQVINTTIEDEPTFFQSRNMRSANSSHRISDYSNHPNMMLPTSFRSKIQTYADVEYSDNDDDEVICTNPRNKPSIPNLARINKSSVIFPDHIPVIVENRSFVSGNMTGNKMLNGNASEHLQQPAIKTFNRHTSTPATMKPPESRDTWHDRLSTRRSRESIRQIPPLIDARTGRITTSSNPTVVDSAGNFGSASRFLNGFDLTRRNRSESRLPEALPIRSTASQYSGAGAGANGTGTQRTNNSIVEKSFNIKDHKGYLNLLKRIVPGLYKSNDTEQDQQRLSQLAEARGSGRKDPKVLATINLDDDDEQQSNEIIDLSVDDAQMITTCRKFQGATKQEEKHELPQVEPVNSLKDKLDTNPTLKADWLDKFSAKYDLKRQLSNKQIAEAEQDSQQIGRETVRQAKSLEDRLQACILDYKTIVLDEEEEEEEFPELTDEQENLIKRAIYRGAQDEVLISKFNMNITRRDINTLQGDTWLNDEVINFYMNLIVERSELRSSEGMPRVYAMNTFFVPRLLQSGHSGVRRWTRKVDIFSYDIIPVPVHVGQVHWCMAIIHLRNRTIKYYDSMGTPNPKLLNALEEYLREESLDKRKESFDTGKFSKESVASAPRQMNGSDCGVFSCMFAEYITRNREITFSQQHMPYFRQKMILEIVQGKLLLSVFGLIFDSKLLSKL